MDKAIFVTDHLGAKHLYDHLGLIGKFQNTSSDIITTDDGIRRHDVKKPQVWVMVLTDPDLIARARAYPGFGRTFREVESEPLINTMKNIKTVNDPNNPQYTQAAEQKDFDKEKAELKAKSQRYGSLFSQICKAGGEYLKDADPTLVAEFEKLKLDLGIETEKDNEKD